MSDSRLLRRIAEDFDWQEYVETNFDYKIVSGRNGTEYKIVCPSCGNRKQKCYVNPERKLFNCYMCDFHTGPHDVYDFVAYTEGMSRGKAILKLLNEYQPTTPDDNIFVETLHHVFIGKKLEEEQEDEITTIEALPTEARKLTPGDPGAVLFWRYLLEDRGLTEREVLSMQTHYIPEESVPLYKANGKWVGDIGHRVLWPIYGGAGDLVSWQAREIPVEGREDSDQKYLFCPDTDAGHTLWPYVPPYTPHVILVEGILDCMGVRRLGNPFSAYATFSKHISEEQIRVLKKWGVKEVTLFWDKKDAKKEMMQAAEQLQMRNLSPHVCDLRNWPKDLDPGKCLKIPNGDAMLRETLSKRISVEDIGYSSWTVSF